MIHKNETHTKMGPIEKIHKTETHKTQKWSKKWGSQTLSTKMRLSKNINKNETHKKKHKTETHKNVLQKCNSQNWSTKWDP